MSRRRRPPGAPTPPPRLLEPPAAGYPIPDDVDVAAVLRDWRQCWEQWCAARAEWAAGDCEWPGGEVARLAAEGAATPDELFDGADL